MAFRFDDWGRGLMRWVAYVTPVILVLIWMDTRYITRTEIARIVEAEAQARQTLTLRNDHAVAEITRLRFALAEVNEQIATLNGYLAAQTGAPFATPRRR